MGKKNNTNCIIHNTYILLFLGFLSQDDWWRNQLRSFKTQTSPAVPRRCWLWDETHSSVHRKNSWRARWPCIISNHRSKLAPFFRSPRRKARRFCCRPRPARAGLGSGGEDTCDSVTSDLREAVTAWMCSFSKAKLQGSPGTANTSNNVCPTEDVWRCVNVSAHSLSMPLLTLWGQVVTMSPCCVSPDPSRLGSWRFRMEHLHQIVTWDMRSTTLPWVASHGDCW